MNRTKLTLATKSSIRKLALSDRDKERLILAQEGEIAHLKAIVAAQDAFLIALTLGQSDFVDGHGEIVRAIGIIR